MQGTALGIENPGGFFIQPHFINAGRILEGETHAAEVDRQRKRRGIGTTAQPAAHHGLLLRGGQTRDLEQILRLGSGRSRTAEGRQKEQSRRDENGSRASALDLPL